MKKPEIICMCGSTRFADLMAAISWEYEKLGKIVLRVNWVPQWYADKSGMKENDHIADQQGFKEILDNLHFRKIDMCDKVFVCDVNGYVGKSTTNEINYAISINKPMFFLNLGQWDPEIYKTAAKLERWWIDAK